MKTIVLESNLPAEHAYKPIAKNSSEAMGLTKKADHITIYERPLYNLNGKSNGYKEIYDNRGNWLSTVGTRYEAIEHHHIRELAIHAIRDMGFDYDVKEAYPKYGRDALLSFRIKGVNEEVIPTLILRNTYKSGNALKVFNGALTRVCTNGAVFGDKEGLFSHAHINKLESKFFTMQIQAFLNAYTKHIEKLEVMKGIAVNAMIKQIFLDALETEKAKKEIFNLFYNRTNTAYSNRKDDSLHSLYQSATEYFSHNKKLSAFSKINHLKKVDLITTAVLVA